MNKRVQKQKLDIKYYEQLYVDSYVNENKDDNARF